VASLIDLIAYFFVGVEGGWDILMASVGGAEDVVGLDGAKHVENEVAVVEQTRAQLLDLLAEALHSRFPV
jgi:hypothetical protein